MSKKIDKKALIFSVVSNPVRIKIIEILASQGPMSFSDLKKILNISTGSIYHHLAQLSNFIEQDENRKYKLNPEGRRLYEFLKKNKEKIGFAFEEDKKSFLLYMSNLAVYVYTGENTKLLFLLPLFLLGSAYVLQISSLETRMLFLKDVQFLSFESSLIQVTISWLSVFLISEILSYLFQRTRGGHVDLLLNVSITFIPLIIFSIFWFFTSKILEPNFLRAIFALFQAWSLAILIKGLQFSKGLSLERSLVISLVIFFISAYLQFLIP